MSKKLYYFTNSYPYGIGEQWKKNELDVLVNYFDSITVIPYSFAGNKDKPKPLPSNVKLEQPLFENAGFYLKPVDLLSIFFNPLIFKFLNDIIRDKRYLKRHHIITWLIGCKEVLRLLNHQRLSKLLKVADKSTVLYFFWGRGTSEIVPFIDCNLYNKVVVKMHRYDLYEYGNDGYLPFRTDLLKLPIIVAPSSNDGEIHLKTKYTKHLSQIITLRCGTIGNELKAKFSTDDKIRIVSCSFLVPVKRIHLMLEACSHLRIPYEWKHIGFGLLEAELKFKAKLLGVDKNFHFIGKINSEKILDYYTENSIDLFVNTSESEGVPFSIMEAFSVGIPVFATNVGGTSEIVDDSVGKLLDHDLQAQNLAELIADYYNKSKEDKLIIRENAYKKYLDVCNANTLANELGKLLTQ
jgi:glycosyltransferase involved in cell wall biosynthesis